MPASPEPVAVAVAFKERWTPLGRLVYREVEDLSDDADGCGEAYHTLPLQRGCGGSIDRLGDCRRHEGGGSQALNECHGETTTPQSTSTNST